MFHVEVEEDRIELFLTLKGESIVHFLNEAQEVESCDESLVSPDSGGVQVGLIDLLMQLMLLATVCLYVVIVGM